MVVFFQNHAAMALFLVRDLGLAKVPLTLRTASWPHARTLALGAFLTGAGFGGMALAGGVAGIAATVVVWTVGEMLLPARSRAAPPPPA